MDRELYNAAIYGNTDALLHLMELDELILDRTTSITTKLETPLHLAAMRGHQRFVSELLNLKPEMASELDSTQSSPLHLAARKGHVEIVRDLVRTNPNMCLARDKDGRNPVHVAAMMGRIDALKEMVGVKVEGARAVVGPGGGKTVLHLCVEYSQLEALKLLAEMVDFGDLVNSKDRNGDTALHLAIADKQPKTTEFLLSIAGIDVDTLNLNGKTAMDILIQRRRDIRDVEMEETLKRVGALGSRENGVMPEHTGQSMYVSSKDFQKLIKSKDDWLEKKRSAMMVVATLIAGMAFQVGVNPPDKIWASSNDNTAISDRPGDIKYYLTIVYVHLRRARFYTVNTIGFIASLSIIFLLMSGLPLKNRIFTSILMFITWIAITAIALTYTVALIYIAPIEQRNSISSMVGITVFVWICLMTLLVLGHTIRLIFWTIRLFFRMIKMVTRGLTAKRKRSIHQHSHV